MQGINNLLLEVGTMYNKGTKYLEKQNYKKALQYLRPAVGQYAFKEGYVNLGNTYRGLGQYGPMLECYKKAIRDDVPYLEVPVSVETDTFQHALNNLGLAYYMLGDDDKAIFYYNKAIARNPKFWEAWWNKSTAMLRKASAGDVELFPAAWEMYNARFLKSGAIKLKNTREDLKFWVPGTSVDRILVLAEQGIGDNIMFGRYLSRLSEFGEVIVQCDASLDVIFSDYKCVRDAAEISVEWAYPMCSLAGALGGNIPAADWLRGRFGRTDFGDGFNVGIVWAGSSTHANNHNRSVAIGRFNRLAAHCNLYALSPGFSGTKYVAPLDVSSWSKTAAHINGLDLVIGVDTSVMHMVGSLGARGWLLQPCMETDFRWGHGSSVWYPEMNIFSNNNDWEDVFARVEAELAYVTR